MTRLVVLMYYRNKIYFLIVFLWPFSPAFSQLISSDSLNVFSQKYYDVPYFSYGMGLGIMSPDSLYKLNIRFRMQNRVATQFNRGRAESLDARVRRLRLRFEGHVYNPRIFYVIQLSFSIGDMGITEDELVPNVIRDAMILYQVSEKFRIGFGQTKLPGNRQRVNSSGDMQLVDRSIVNAVFNIDRDVGIQAFYNGDLHGNFKYVLRGAVSSGEGRNPIPPNDRGLAFTGRIELLPFGFFTNNGDYFEGDLIRERTPKVSIGLTNNFNNGAKRTGGQLGRELFEARDIQTYMADFLLKYNGLSVSSEYIRRNAQDPITMSSTNPDDLAYVYNGEGFNTQTGYLLPNNLEFIGRYSFIKPDREIWLLEKKITHYTIGATRYIKGHRLKIQTDLTYEMREDLFNQTKSNNWQWRFQVELGI
ncbi:MAG: porin [Cyclobacteriaceae bacterium]|nr:porin [Cyclobacteriaceae bacterium]